MDVSVIKHLRSKFVEWYSNELMKHFNDVDDSDDIELQAVDLSSANLREIGALWFVEAANYISDTPSSTEVPSITAIAYLSILLPGSLIRWSLSPIEAFCRHNIP